MPMTRPARSLAAAAALLALAAAPAAAGGAWVPDQGDGWVSIGYNSKTGDRRLDADGDNFEPAGGRRHDFRYAYLSGEVGVAPRVSVTWLSTYLWGRELFDDASRNFSHHGFSDQWVGARVQLRRGRLPLAAEVNARLPYLYEGSERWLGVLKHDFTGLLHAGHVLRSRGTLAGYAGFTYRQGAPANQLRCGAEWALPSSAPLLRALPFQVTVGLDGFVSVGDPTASEPSDRFGQRDRRPSDVNYFTFNKSSWARPWVSLWTPLGGGWGAQAGYGRIGFGGLGRSVHLYDDLYASLTYAF